MTSRIPFVVVITVLLLGCGRKTGATTPESAFAGARLAYESRDWETYLDWHDPDERRAFVGLAQVAATIIALRKPETASKLSEIEASHGLLKLDQDPGAAKPNVKNASKAYGDLVRFCEAHGSPEEAPVFHFGELTGLSVNGDVATGQTSNAQGIARPVKLVRKRGLWRVGQ